MIVIAAAFAKFAGVQAGVPAEVAVAVAVAVLVEVLVAVFAGVLVFVGVDVEVGVPDAQGNVMLSIRTPTTPVATAPLSVASRHLS